MSTPIDKLVLTWPVRIGVEYEEDGPALMCDGWVQRRIVTGKVITEQCRASFHGSTLAELHAEVGRHIEMTPHEEHW